MAEQTAKKEILLPSERKMTRKERREYTLHEMKRNYQAVETVRSDSETFTLKQSYATLDTIKEFAAGAAKAWNDRGYTYSLKAIYKPTKEVVWEF